MGRAFPFLIVLLAAFAFEPVLRAGLTAGDYEWMLGAGGGNPARRSWIALSSAAYGLSAPGSPALGLRAESLLVLGALVLGLRAFLVRLLTPWTGATQAAVAGGSAAALALLHPLAPGFVAGLEGRGQLLGLGCTCWAAALYLRGRQERDTAASLACLALFLAAGFATHVAFFGVVLVTGAEYVSARRTRSPLRRLRTAATAFVGATLAVHLAALWGLGPQSDRTVSEAGALLRAVDGLGWLLLPPSSGLLGSAEVWLAAGLGFLAVQPVFRAARHAPRLWGTLFASWALVLLFTLWMPVERGAEARLDHVWPWFPTVLALASGMGLSASALRGGRGRALRLALCVVSALLAHGNAQRFLAAGPLVAAVHADLAQEQDDARRVLVLDPPAPAVGFDPLGRSLAWLRHPRLRGGPDGPFDPARTHQTSRAGFLALTRTETFESWRAEGLSVLPPAEPGARRRLVTLAAPWVGPEARTWRASLTQRYEPELDPLRFEALRLRAAADHDPAELQRLGWSARVGGEGSLPGVVRAHGAELEAFFGLSSMLEWRLAGPVRSLVLERAVEPILLGEWLERLPAPEPPPVPMVVGDDWSFEPFAVPGFEDGQAVLVLLDLEELTCVELGLTLESGRAWARGAEGFVSRSRARDATVTWSLEYRVDGQALLRTNGRRP